MLRDNSAVLARAVPTTSTLSRPHPWNFAARGHFDMHLWEVVPAPFSRGARARASAGASVGWRRCWCWKSCRYVRLRGPQCRDLWHTAHRGKDIHHTNSPRVAPPSSPALPPHVPPCAIAPVSLYLPTSPQRHPPFACATHLGFLTGANRHHVNTHNLRLPRQRRQLAVTCCSCKPCRQEPCADMVV